ncbi:TPA: DNA polymerase V [Enterobacter ludwigii]|uniref:DNA polymerase V n=1 Tax=Enterobacter ludwigii TaxID=299767 RepID=UPI0032F1C3FC|nr:DNA polymerase V [Enterobacter ludwigii]
MPRTYEIEGAFKKAIKIEQNGRRTVQTSDFVRELRRFNWDWTLRQANQWIEVYITTFKDISTMDGDDRLFMLYNPNNG